MLCCLGDNDKGEKSMPVRYRCNLCRPNHRVHISNSVTTPTPAPNCFHCGWPNPRMQNLWLWRADGTEAGRQMNSAPSAQSTSVSEERWHSSCALMESHLVLFWWEGREHPSFARPGPWLLHVPLCLLCLWYPGHVWMDAWKEM